MRIDSKIKTSLTRKATKINTNLKEMTLLVGRDHPELFQPSVYRRILALIKAGELPQVAKVGRGKYVLSPVKPARKTTAKRK